MILLCVGNSIPFNRLVRTVDNWVDKKPTRTVFAQIGNAEFEPKNIGFIDFFENENTRAEQLNKAGLLVCDMSLDLLLPAIERGLPILALPRLSIFGEETGIDQITLAKNLKSDNLIHIARDEFHLEELLSSSHLPYKTSAQHNRCETKSSQFQTNLSRTIREAG
ncbi:MAG: hypothetical protein L3J13_09255 [Devosiaceae bacterium]|nr:hypothetical protein [Devosiaceae bacterium]